VAEEIKSEKNDILFVDSRCGFSLRKIIKSNPFNSFLVCRQTACGSLDYFFIDRRELLESTKAVCEEPNKYCLLSSLMRFQNITGELSFVSYFNP